MDFKDTVMSLRKLSVDYYKNHISFTEYREKRSELLMMIDEELNGVKVFDDKEKSNESFINKALSFLKVDKLKEIN